MVSKRVKSKVRRYAYAAMFILLSGCVMKQGLRRIDDWAILLNYSGYDPAAGYTEKYKDYDILILDPDCNPGMLHNRHTLFFAYLSIGEAESYREYWDIIKNEGFILEENPEWKGNYYVDITAPAWSDLIISRVIPGIISKGFDGLFLDTIDTVDILKEKFPVGEPEKHMAEFIKKIKETFPGLKLISNNGFSVLEEIAGYVDIFLCEDIYMMPDFEKGGYKDVPAEDREYKVDILKNVSARTGKPVLVIDYLPEDDIKRKKETSRKIRKLGFKPYIAQKELDRIYRQ
ncbi:MAG: endo alpha-1,4 polygalactosaminidase [Elusimicrobiota bacterium]